MEAHTATGAALIDDLHEMSESKTSETMFDGQPVRFGRLVDTEKLDRLDADEIESAIDQNLIYFGDQEKYGRDKKFWKVAQDGSIQIRLAPTEFLLDETRLLSSRDRRMNILAHGRSGLVPFVANSDRDPNSKLDKFFVGGVSFSPGHFDWQIRESLYDKNGVEVRQIPSASYFDGNRIMGVDSQLRTYDRLRQVELAVDGGEVDLSELWVSIDVFHPKATDPRTYPITWGDLTFDQRREVHKHGFGIDRALGLADSRVYDALVDQLTDEKPAYIMTRNGVTGVKAEPTRRFMDRSIEEAATLLGQQRTNDDYPDLEPLLDRLNPAGERSRILVVNDLSPESIDELAASADIRAFVVSGLGEKAFTKEDHMMLRRAVNRDVAIFWQDPAGNVREFGRSGHWMLPGIMDDFRSQEIGVSMYVSHKDPVKDALAESAGTFLDNLGTLAKPEHIAIYHGNGPGGMELFDQLARKRRMISVGTGIDLEQQGQGKANFRPQAAVEFHATDRLYRQQIMDSMNTIPVFNVGGYGTLEELAITLCSHKLLLTLPTPMVIVDASGVFRGVKETIDDIANTKRVEVEGNVIDLSKAPLGPEWVPETVHMVESYDDAFEVIRGFINDPSGYWQERGVTADHVQTAIENQMTDISRYGMVIPNSLLRKIQPMLPNSG